MLTVDVNSQKDIDVSKLYVIISKHTKVLFVADFTLKSNVWQHFI